MICAVIDKKTNIIVNKIVIDKISDYSSDDFYLVECFDSEIRDEYDPSSKTFIKKVDLVPRLSPDEELFIQQEKQKVDALKSKLKTSFGFSDEEIETFKSL